MNDTNLSTSWPRRSAKPKPDRNSSLAELFFFFFRTRSFSNDTSVPTGSFTCRIPLWVIHKPTKYEFSILLKSNLYLKHFYKGLPTRINRSFSTVIFGVTIGMIVIVAPINVKLFRIGALKQWRYAGGGNRKAVCYSLFLTCR